MLARPLRRSSRLLWSYYSSSHEVGPSTVSPHLPHRSNIVRNATSKTISSDVPPASLPRGQTGQTPHDIYLATQALVQPILLEMRRIIGPTLVADFEAMSFLDLYNGDYSLSRHDFHLKGKEKGKDESSLSRPVLGDDAIQELQRCIDRLNDTGADSVYVKQAYLLFWYAQANRSIRSGSSDDDQKISPLEQLLVRFPQWAPKRSSTQPMVNLLRRTGSVKEMQTLLELLPRQIPKRTRPEDLAGPLDLCVLALQAPSKEIRQSARSYLGLLLKDQRAFGLVSSLQLASLLASYCRAAHGWADDPLAAKMAHELEDHRMSVPSLDGTSSSAQDPDHQMLLYSIATQRALSSANATQGRWSSTSALTQWIGRMRYRGFLEAASSSFLVHSIVLRAHDRELDFCETADEAMLLLQRITNDCNQLAAGRSSWGWAIRSLLGIQTGLIRPLDASEQRPTSDLLKIDEASFLLESFQPRLPTPVPTPFLVYPLMQALLACFPPKIDRCMTLYRQMRLPLQDSRRNFLRHLSFFGKDAIKPAVAEGPDRETLVLLLDWLSKHVSHDNRQRDDLAAIVEDLIKDRREWVLLPRDRMMYGVAILRRHRDAEDGLASWHRLCTQSEWCQGWTSEQWKGFLWQLAGLGQRDQRSIVLSETPKDAGESSPLVRLASTLPAVPLPVLMQVMLDMAKRSFSPGIKLYTQLIKMLGNLASAASLAAWSPLPSATIFGSQANARSLLQDVYQTVQGVHSLLLIDSTLSPDLAALNALMDAYSRCDRPDIVWELWDRLALASLSSSGLQKKTVSKDEVVNDHQLEALVDQSSLSNDASAAYVTVCSHGSLDAVSLSILLDTTGRSPSWADHGMRAWRFAGRLDERTLTTLSSSSGARAECIEYVSLIRNQNAWNSWLEFLCRTRRLEEAVDQLDAMIQDGKARVEPSLTSTTAAVASVRTVQYTRESIPCPDAKTLGTLLRFAARRRDREAGRRMSGNESHQQPSQSCIWHQLRARVQRDEFGQIWEQVKDIGISTE